MIASGGTACAHGVSVQTEPPGAIVVVDGVEHGPAPVRFVEQAGDGTPTIVEARAPGHRPARVEVHPTSFSVPAAAAGLGCGALACAGCVATSFALSFASPVLLVGAAAGAPLLAVPAVVGLALGRRLPETIVVKLEPLEQEGAS